ncbi:MAG: hypothetical protein IJT27_10080 [Clostridia bacterium]|nr:hypothetical protein [Clostridia bacterium]
MKKLIKKSESKFNKLESFKFCGCKCDKCGCAGNAISPNQADVASSTLNNQKNTPSI